MCLDTLESFLAAGSFTPFAICSLTTFAIGSLTVLVCTLDDFPSMDFDDFVDAGFPDLLIIPTDGGGTYVVPGMVAAVVVVVSGIGGTITSSTLGEGVGAGEDCSSVLAVVVVVVVASVVDG